MTDTERVYFEATQSVCSMYGKEYTWEIKSQCMGMKGPLVAKHIINCLQLPLEVEEYSKKIAELTKAAFRNIELLAGTSIFCCGIMLLHETGDFYMSYY